MRRLLYTFGWLLLFAPSLAAGQGLSFLNSPRGEAEYLALELSGELRPPSALADQIQSDLAAIRFTFPQYADIRAFPAWMPGEVLLGMTPTAYSQFKNGTFTGFLPQFAELGIPIVDTHDSGQWLHFRFGQMYHGQRLAEHFDFVDGVRYADPNGIIGDGDDVEAKSNRTYILSRGSGDCLAGCIYHDSWSFFVNDQGAFRGTPPITPPHMPGDFNHDGTVDAADYTVWRDGLYSMYQPSEYADFIHNFGKSLGAAAGNVAGVPEPRAAALVLLGTLLGGFHLRSARRD